MARKSSAGPLIILGTIFLVFLVVLAAMPRSPLPLGGGWILGHRLTEEVTPPQVLYSTTLNLEPGQVYQVTYNANGITVTQRSSQLIERLNLTGDIGADDIIAPHLYDAYGGYVLFSGLGITSDDANITVRVYKYPTSDDTAFRTFIRFFGSGKYEINWQFGYSRNRMVQIYLNSSDVLVNTGITYSIFNDFPIDTWYTASFIYDVKDNRTAIYQDGQQVTSGEFGAGADYITINNAYIYLTSDIHKAIVSYVRLDEDGKPAFLFDPTFANGTRYFDLVGNIAGTPYDGVQRISASQTWLWLVKGLESDSRLHVRYVPPGSIFRIKYDNMIYEWRIDGTPNAAGLIADYPIDIAGVFGQTTLPNATVELIYPSQKVRFYIPSGFQVQITSSNWTETHQTPLNSSYVDFGLPKGGTYTIRVLGYEEQPRVTVETTSSSVKVTVTDPYGYALSGAKVYIYNNNNELAAAGVTNDFGVFQFNKTLLNSDQARIIVSHLSNGYYYHMDKLVTLNGLVTIQPRYPRPINLPEAAATGGSNSSAAVGIVIILLLAVLAVALLAGRRR